MTEKNPGPFMFNIDPSKTIQAPYSQGDAILSLRMLGNAGWDGDRNHTSWRIWQFPDALNRKILEL